MSDTVIQVENLSKRYRIGLKEQIHDTLGGAIIDFAKRPVANWHRLRKLSHFSDAGGALDVIWALKDISFEVHRGEIVGLIGSNGAGKSTLLKILSRITEPTEGRAVINGRVGSLLEVGTGFHPELTGRENVYLNGTILGMKKVEIDRKFDEIVAFSGVEKFIDTPVKRYSSGMRVRLAFAVAAHLEPEILLVDEVLAVGDVAFQKKCLGKMGDVAGEGRTVLFVSHKMQAVRALCPRSVLLNEGAIIADASTADTLMAYYELQRQMEVDADTDVMNPKNRRGSGAVRFTKIRIEDKSVGECAKLMMGSTIRFVLSYQVFAPVDKLLIGIFLLSGISREIVTSVKHSVSEERLSPGCTGAVVIELPNVNLRPGEYPLYFWLGEGLGRPFDIVDDLTVPLIIYTDKDVEDLDYDLSRAAGFFNIDSKMIRLPE